MKTRLIVLLSLIAIAAGAKAQTAFVWNIDFETVFDNREGDRTHTDPETVFFTRLRPTVGFQLGKGDSFAGGIEWIQPIAYDWHGHRVRPVLYYRHTSQHWGGSLGIFPREQLFEEMPSFMWSDSTAYFQPDIRGALLQWHDGRSFAEIYLDWRQKQTATKRESFTITAHGRWQHPHRPYMAGAYLTMNHLALTKNAPDNMHIVDNFMAAPYIGAYLTPCATPLDSLRLRLGMAMTVERNRELGKWHTPTGAWFEIIAGWRGFRIKNMLYAGGRLLPSYGLFGSTLYQGEPYYTARFYDRAELSYGIVRRSLLDLRASLDFHFTPGSFMFYQKISLTLRFGQRYSLSRGNETSGH